MDERAIAKKPVIDVHEKKLYPGGGESISRFVYRHDEPYIPLVSVKCSVLSDAQTTFQIISQGNLAT